MSHAPWLQIIIFYNRSAKWRNTKHTITYHLWFVSDSEFFFENEFNSNQTVFGWFVEVNGGLVEIVVFIQSKDIYRFQDSVGYST